MKAVYFNSVYPVCHAFDQDSKDGHDLLIGMSSGDGIVYCDSFYSCYSTTC